MDFKDAEFADFDTPKNMGGNHIIREFDDPVKKYVNFTDYMPRNDENYSRIRTK
jgi:hypothetical protein